MTEQNPRLGILLAILTTIVFAVQDGISRHLAGEYSAWTVVMIRFWFFAAFALAVVARSPGGVRAAASSSQLGLQILRALVLVLEIIVVLKAFVVLGLVETHAVFASCPLLVAALSGPVLGEKVGWRRWIAIAIGFAGILIILGPGSGTLTVMALVPLFGALLFAIYVLLTRYVSRRDSAMTSFFWTGVVGAVAMTPPGLWFWQPMSPPDWGWMFLLCICGALTHWMLIKTYEMVEASVVQPFVYLQLVFSSAIGIVVFGESLAPNILLGAAIIVAAGLFTLWRERLAARR